MSVNTNDAYNALLTREINKNLNIEATYK